MIAARMCDKDISAIRNAFAELKRRENIMNESTGADVDPAILEYTAAQLRVSNMIRTIRSGAEG